MTRYFENVKTLDELKKACVLYSVVCIGRERFGREEDHQLDDTFRGDHCFRRMGNPFKVIRKPLAECEGLSHMTQ